MDAIALMMSLFLNLNAPCDAGPAEWRRIGMEDFQVLTFTCGAKHFEVWQRRCVAPPAEGVEDQRRAGYWSRPFFLQETNTREGFYLNRFAEVHAGAGIHLGETYIPPCGT